MKPLIVKLIYVRGLDDPSDRHLRGLFQAPQDWQTVLSGGREHIALALPPGWDVELLSARETVEACRAGLPVLPNSVHGRRQGLIVHNPDGAPWRPPEAQLVVWDSRARRWRERGPLRNPLACGEPCGGLACLSCD